MTDLTAPAFARAAPPRRRARALTAMALIVVVCLLAPFAVVGWYVRSAVVNTEHFVNTVTPLIRDEAVQDALVDRVATEVLKLADQVAPGLVTRQQVVDVASSFVATAEFESLWRGIMREAHPQFENVLLGRDSDLVRTADGQVQLDLVLVARQVQDRLVAAGLTQAADLDLGGELLLPLFESQELATVQRANDLIERWVPWISAALVLAFVLAIAIAPRRGAALKWSGIGLLIGAFLLGAGLLIGRLQYLSALEQVVPRDAASAAYTILLDPLIGWIRVWIAVALVLIVAGLLLSPWRRGTATGATAPSERARLGHWLAGHRLTVVAVAIAVGFGVILMWHRPTVVVLLVTVGVVTAVIIAGLLLGTRAANEMGA